jgi:hypothetical protein
MEAFLKEDESQVDLEVSFALGRPVFNCPSSQVRGSISFIHSGSLRADYPASTL